MDNHQGGINGDSSGGERTNETDSTEIEAPKEKRTRGPTRLEKLVGKGPFPLQWDRSGCPTGDHATSFASYCGKRVRCQVNINLEDWDKNVEVGIKNLLWEDISKKYLIHERYKDHVLSSCGTKWKDFKGKLTLKWIRNKHPKYKSPADCYSYIEHADWEKLKTLRETEKYKEISRKASECAMQNEHPQRMGRRGYSQRVYKRVAAEASKDSSSSVSLSDLVTDRSWRWIKGRSKSDGTIPNDKTKKVSEEMDEWRNKIKSGEFIPNRYDDVLSRSLDKKKYPGRVRAFSGGVTIKDVFGTSHWTSKRTSGISDTEVAEISKRVRKETIDSLGDLIRHETLCLLKRAGIEVPEDLDEHQSSCQSANQGSHEISKESNPTPNPKKIEKSTKCQLACVHGGVTFIVAEATVYPPQDSNEVVHGMPLLIDNVRVSIDKVLEGTSLLPIPTQYHDRVADAAGSFVKWPKKLIVIENFTSSAALTKGKELSKGSATKPPTNPELDDCSFSIAPKCQKLHDLLASMPPRAKTFEVVEPSTVFNIEEEKIMFVTGEEIDQLFRMAFLKVSCIKVFMLFLQNLCEKEKNEGLSAVGYLCPKIMSQIGDDKEINDQVMNYIEGSLLKMNGVGIILVPFCQKNH